MTVRQSSFGAAKVRALREADAWIGISKAFLPTLQAEGQNPVTLDSKDPDGTLQAFLEGEIRYVSLKRSFPDEAARLARQLESEYIDRFNRLKLMADPTLACKPETPEE